MPQYNVDTGFNNLVQPLASLNVLYENMPETSGCEKCEEINGDNKQWCCQRLGPSMYYVEFLNLWQEIQDHWGKDKKKSVRS